MDSSAKRGMSLEAKIRKQPSAFISRRASYEREKVEMHWKGETTLLSFSMKTRCSGGPAVGSAQQPEAICLLDRTHRGCWEPSHRFQQDGGGSTRKVSRHPWLGRERPAASPPGRTPMMRVEYDILVGAVVRCLRVCESLARAIVGDEMLSARGELAAERSRGLGTRSLA